jgi:hypothetical protein
VTDVRFPIEAGAILLFSRAVNDDDPAYTDVEHARRLGARDVVAPLTFTASSAQFDPDYPLRPRPGVPWMGSGATPTGLRRDSSDVDGDGEKKAATLHAEQHYEYHRAPVAGEVLTAMTVPGKRWEKDGRSGRLLFRETVVEYRDVEGDLVVTSRGVGVTPLPRESPAEGKA